MDGRAPLGEAKSLFTELFTAWEVLHYIGNVLPCEYWQGQRRAKKRTKKIRLPSSLVSQARGLEIDQSRFSRLLEQHIEVLERGEKPSCDLKDFIESHCRVLEDQLGIIPNTLDKARDSLRALVEVGNFDIGPLYDAMVLLGEALPSDIVTKVIRAWKEDVMWCRQHRKRGPGLQSDIFWASRDFMETLDGVSRYRFRESFRIGEFEETFREVEQMFACALLEGSSGADLISVPFCGDQKLTSVAFDLWLASRSYRLPNRIRDFLSVALRRVAGWQSPEGWWTDFQRIEVFEHGRTSKSRMYQYAPSTYTTALCSLDLLKLATAEPLREKGALGARWLVERQDPDGSWPREVTVKGKVEAKPDIFTTILAVEALVRSGIEGLDRSVQLGYDWVISQQNHLGMWEDDGFPFPLMTVLVLELAELVTTRAKPPRLLQPYLQISRGFLDRSVQLSLEENSNSHRLAIIAAYQGIEAFLYGLLNQPSVNIKIFESPDQTIGMRKALTRFQTYLEDRGMLPRGGVVAYRNSLDRLGFLRGQVVHKGLDITQAECRPLIDDAVSFARRYSREILQFDMWT